MEETNKKSWSKCGAVSESKSGSTGKENKQIKDRHDRVSPRSNLLSIKENDMDDKASQVNISKLLKKLYPNTTKNTSALSSKSLTFKLASEAKKMEDIQDYKEIVDMFDSSKETCQLLGQME